MGATFNTSPSNISIPVWYDYKMPLAMFQQNQPVFQFQYGTIIRVRKD